MTNGMKELFINKYYNELIDLKKSCERLQILGVCRTFQDSKYMHFLKSEIPRIEGKLKKYGAA